MIVGVHLTKRANWHGVAEEWDSVYHYATPTITTESGWEGLADAVANAERELYGPSVSIIRCRIHGPTNTTKAEDIMRLVKDYALPGTKNETLITPPESAVVVRWFLGRSTQGYKQILKKFYRYVALFDSGATQQMADGRVALNAAIVTRFVNFGNSMKTLTIGAGDNHLVNSQGKNLPVGTNAEVLKYTHTRQFRKGRKEKTTP